MSSDGLKTGVAADIWAFSVRSARHKAEHPRALEAAFEDRGPALPRLHPLLRKDL